MHRVEIIELTVPLSADFDFDERDELEEALDSALRARALGEVCGSGAGPEGLDLAIAVDERLAEQPQEAVAAVLDVIRALGVPAGAFLLTYPGLERIPV